jgi:ferritin-like metal-binding protein YciE
VHPSKYKENDYMALKDVLIDELRDMYCAENQLVKALPKLAKGAVNPKLKQLFSLSWAKSPPASIATEWKG